MTVTAPPTTPAPPAGTTGFGGRIRDGKLDAEVIRRDFPVLGTEVHGRPLVFLDSASTSQKPQAVIDALDGYYNEYAANVHRGIYEIGERATAAYEAARVSVGKFINAPDSHEVIFTRNATEAINLVAYSWGRRNIGRGDAIVLTEMEHHANLVPWQLLAQEMDGDLEFIPITDDGVLRQDVYEVLLRLKPKLVAFTHVSNTLGTINPVREMVDAAHEAGALVLIDGAQAVPHVPVDVQAIGADFYVFSGHKMLGPTGVGVLWGREELLDAMPPFLGGGDMIRDVRLDGFTPNELPWKFEAGTPPIAEVIGLGAACDELERYGLDNIREHEKRVTGYAIETLTERFGDGITIHGPLDVESRSGVLSFAFKGLHPHDISQVLDEAGVCVRAGHHCAKPLMRCLGVGATARASFYVYNDEADVDALAEALQRCGEFFGL
jgi:cysteine desulfurase/selenocysteine lyase